MSIFVNRMDKIIVQGITGRAAQLHTKAMLDYGTNIAGGVTPGKGGREVHGVPVFNLVSEAVKKTGANTSIIFVPPAFVKEAILEAVDGGIRQIVCITEHVPVHDVLVAEKYARSKGVRLIGPNCPGIIVPEEQLIGIMPGAIHRRGNIGIVSRSGTLTYEAVAVLTENGFGQSTVVGIGGDPIKGVDFIEVLEAFEKDLHTDAVILIGEIGGESEERAAAWIQRHMQKPVVGFISGKSAPKDKTMGHAGAIVSGGTGTAESKTIALENAGVKMAHRLNEIVPILKKIDVKNS